MIRRVIEFSANNKFIVLVLTAVALVGAVYCMRHIPLDAIPDLSDTQVIVYSRWDRSPDIIEDQVTYPIVSALLGAPKVKAIRGLSDFGFSYVSIIFEDGTDLYWARSRTLEYLSKIMPRLPEGVKTELGPDATGVGWVFQYALVDRTGRHDLSTLRGIQDWSLRYWLQAVPGVAEVASIGGFQKQYQVTVDPQSLLAYGIPLSGVIEAIRQGNQEVGGRLVEMAGAEYMVRGRGYARSIADLEEIVVGQDGHGTPVRVREIGRVVMGPDIRRGVADLDGEGDTVGGIVVMRHGENALSVINRIKDKIDDIRPSLPEGVEIVTTYDRSDLIERAIATLKSELILEMLIVSIVILIFLWHIPSATIPIVTIPVAVALSFIPMYAMGVSSNIMSLAGIAISIGVLVDGAIVEVENAYRKIQVWQQGGCVGSFHSVRLEALMEVGPSVFFSLLVIAVAFLPVFTLVDQEGRLFKPLAYTKTLAIGVAAILAITLDPALRMLFARVDPFRFRPRWLAWGVNKVAVGTYEPEEKHAINRILFRLYEPVCRVVLRFPAATIVVALILVLATIPVYMSLGWEDMPPLDEGTLLYMPITMPGISVTEAQRLLQVTDKLIRETPEVVRVFGKAGRAETATDPAPFSMIETTILLKPHSEWRPVKRFYSEWPHWMQAPLRHLWYDRISLEDLIRELDEKLHVPGLSNAWVMPIKTRIEMLSTGVRTMIGVKVFGPDLNVIEQLGIRIEGVLKDIRGTRSSIAERTASGFFLDFELKRAELARYGLSIGDAQTIIESAIGGATVTTTVEGRERYGVSVRYAREERDSVERLERVLVPTPTGAQVPMAQIADIRLVSGPAMIKNENGFKAGYVYVDLKDRDMGSWVKEARQVVAREVPMPAGYSIQWSGRYENLARVVERLKIVVPITLFLIVVLLYMNTKSAVRTAIVMLAVPFSMIGAVWLLWMLGYNESIAVWVGVIALLGLDAETGVFMLLFLDLSYDEAVREGRMRTKEDLREAIIHGAVRRIRPKMMTVCAAMMGLMPIMVSLGTGSDVMKRIAAPMVGGLVTSFILELLIYPPLYESWKWYFVLKRGRVVPEPSQAV